MRSTRSSHGWVARLVGIGTALGLLAAGVVAPKIAQAGGAQFQSYPVQGSVKSWSGSHAPRHDSRGWGDHGRSGHRPWHSPDPRIDGGPGRHWYDHHHGGRWHPSYAPVYFPPQWVWNGYGWVLAPGYWR